MSSEADRLLSVLRDSELIEWSIIHRLQKNPKIWDEKASEKLSASQTLFQQHEVKRLLDKYVDNQRNTLRSLNDFGDGIIYGTPNFDSLVSNFKSVIEESNEKAIQMLSMTAKEQISDEFNPIPSLYDMMSSNEDYPFSNISSNGQSIQLQSSFTGDLHLSNLFTNTENYGEFMDLHICYNKWLSLPRLESLATDNIPTYLDFLKNLNKRDFKIDINDKLYMDYLKQLFNYLHSFWLNTHPLSTDLKFKEDLFVESRDLKCFVCNLEFAKQGTFDNHLKSKKHIRRCQIDDIKQILLMESRVYQLIELLDDIYKRTVLDVERISLLTTREWQLEQHDKKEVKSPSLVPINFWEQLKSNENHKNSTQHIEEKIDNNPLNLPLGPDGNPIPYWLYKMKGLRKEIKCEICGNKTYRGRNLFSSHFKSKRHIDGLKMLGVMDSFHIYNDLSTIEEVINLLKKRSNNERRNQKFLDDVEQIEINNGEVLSSKVYNQLQKQGLI